MIWALLLLAACGWGVAGFFWSRLARHQCPIAPPTKAVLINSAGLPESIRHLRGPAPKSYHRPRANAAPTEYRPIGHAVIYQATSPRQA